MCPRLCAQRSRARSAGSLLLRGRHLQEAVRRHGVGLLPVPGWRVASGGGAPATGERATSGRGWVHRTGMLMLAGG